LPSIQAAEYMQLCKENHPKKSQPLLPRFGMASLLSTKCPPPLPVENPRKLKEKSRQKTTRYLVRYLIQSGYMESCLAALKSFFAV
jgi:hypothetical protein